MDPEEVRSKVAALESVLVDPAFEREVDMVLSCPDTDTYRAAAHNGSVTFRRVARDGRYRYQVIDTSGVDPLADRSTDRFDDHHTERAAAFPSRAENSYPHAFDSIAQFFDAPHAPEAVAMHSAGHHFDTHLGQHGSLGVIQARGPFIASGAGVRHLGLLDRSTRTVHIAPTVAALLGIDPHPDGVGPTGARRPDALLRRQDGDPEAPILTGDRAEHVVVFLLDGCNANLLLDVMEAGEAPNIAELARRGTHYRHGLMASLPTATLANHTTALTGAHPGHSGVLHNRWFDRATRHAPNLLELDQMVRAMCHLSPEVETLFQAVERSRPGAFTTATFEFCDTGATFSSFGLLREGRPAELPDGPVTHLDPASSDAYRFMSRVDQMSVSHTIAAWDRVEGNPLPTLSWCSLALTDEAGHESGPHGEAARASVRDSDARVGEVLEAVDRAGATDRTAFLVIADHGMEQNDPTNDGLWTTALGEAGVDHLDLDGFLYLDR